MQESGTGNLKFSFDTEELQVQTVRHTLKEYYKERIRFGGVDINALIWDEYVESFWLDGIEFLLNADLGFELGFIFAFGNTKSKGDVYIREICGIFKKAEKNWI